MTRLLAIDPGPTQSAFVVWDGSRIWEHGLLPNEDVLAVVRTIWTHGVAIEMVASYGMPVGREVFDTVVWIGRFYQASLDRWLRHPSLMFRLAVKQHLCHDSRAKDANIRQALIDRLGAPGTKKAPGITYGIRSDEWAALALAVTAFDQQRSPDVLRTVHPAAPEEEEAARVGGAREAPGAGRVPAVEAR